MSNGQMHGYKQITAQSNRDFGTLGPMAPADFGTMDTTRVRLRPWLESRLNEGWIPGLIWVDKDKAIFRIPWKHHSKHTWSEEDALIFKDWAVVTGRYREGIDTPDWPMWKTRLRCALNKAPDIQEVKQHHKLHCDEPFKVYRFISKTESLWRANASRNASMVFDGVPSAGALITSNTPLFIRRNMNTIMPTNRTPTILIQKPSNNGNLSTYNNLPGNRSITVIQRVNDGELYVRQLPQPSQPQLTSYGSLNNSYSQLDTNDTSNNDSQHPLDVGANQEIGSYLGASSSSSLAAAQNDHFESHPHQQIVSNTPSRVVTVIQPNGGIRRVSLATTPVSNHETVVPFLPDIMEPELHQLCLRIQHLDLKVKDTVVTNPNGCCIYYGRYDETASPTAPEPHEPPIPQFVSDKSKPFVDLLLDNMQRGVILTVSHGSIYAERLCKCAIFVYVPTGEEEYRFTRKLSRREREKIFDYDQFIEDVEGYKLGIRPKPSYEIVLAFGQQLKSGQTTDALLVWCRLANCKAWFIMQRSGLFHSTQPIIRQSVGTVVPKMELLEAHEQVEHEEEVIEEGVEEPLDLDNPSVYDGLEEVHDFTD